ncbi:MAG: hypothetical protein CVV05_00910 [Gammaproteobacteria bacterium HGW-Gammaproteobacteria-1]|jgi:hypothetical protein|nr:MAG: hypothetical protein CVV05_00910 [Gammaproteobacteria bacterium HGW-Gammaproteobacteria-1]
MAETKFQRNTSLLQYIVDAERPNKRDRPLPVSPADIERTPYISEFRIQKGAWPKHTGAWRLFFRDDFTPALLRNKSSTFPLTLKAIADRMTSYALKHLLPHGTPLNGIYDYPFTAKAAQHTFPQLLLWAAAEAGRADEMIQALDVHAGGWREELARLWTTEGHASVLLRISAAITHSTHAEVPLEHVLRLQRAMEAECQIIPAPTKSQGLLLFNLLVRTTRIAYTLKSADALPPTPSVVAAIARSGVDLATPYPFHLSGDASAPHLDETVGDFLDRHITSPAAKYSAAVLQWKNAFLRANISPSANARGDVSMPAL